MDLSDDADEFDWSREYTRVEPHSQPDTDTEDARIRSRASSGENDTSSRVVRKVSEIHLESDLDLGSVEVRKSPQENSDTQWNLTPVKAVSNQSDPTQQSISRGTDLAPMANPFLRVPQSGLPRTKSAQSRKAPNEPNGDTPDHVSQGLRIFEYTNYPRRQSMPISLAKPGTPNRTPVRRQVQVSSQASSRVRRQVQSNMDNQVVDAAHDKNDARMRRKVKGSLMVSGSSDNFGLNTNSKLKTKTNLEHELDQFNKSVRKELLSKQKVSQK